MAWLTSHLDSQWDEHIASSETNTCTSILMERSTCCPFLYYDMELFQTFWFVAAYFSRHYSWSSNSLSMKQRHHRCLFHETLLDFIQVVFRNDDSIPCGPWWWATKLTVWSFHPIVGCKMWGQGNMCYKRAIGWLIRFVGNKVRPSRSGGIVVAGLRRAIGYRHLSCHLNACVSIRWLAEETVGFSGGIKWTSQTKLVIGRVSSYLHLIVSITVIYLWVMKVLSW